MKLKIATALAAMTMIATAASASDFVVIPLETTIDAPADMAWARINGFCHIGAWFKTTCEIISGRDGQVGAVRRIAGRIDEVIIARTAWSYTYTMPKSPTDYHGTVEIRPIDASHSRLLYTLVYDADALPKHGAQDKAAERDARTQQFTPVLDAMKAMAEAK
jgi:hypothetical protein